MTISRRRFLSISAAAVACVRPANAAPIRWQGQALGAEVSIVLHAPEPLAHAALTDVQALLREVDAQFSLYDPASALSTLNRDSGLNRPAPMFMALMAAADGINHATKGLFDPTLQPLWQAIARGTPSAVAADAVGWHRIRTSSQKITLARGQALTFNGIAQGFATDLVADALAARGLRETLINIGEYRGIGGAWKLGISDPTHGMLGMRTLTDGAIATSSPLATPLGDHGHIIHPTRLPLWSTVSVEAADATTADGYSTAMTLATRAEILEMKRHDTSLRRITLVDPQGDLSTI